MSGMNEIQQSEGKRVEETTWNASDSTNMIHEARIASGRGNHAETLEAGTAASMGDRSGEAEQRSQLATVTKCSWTLHHRPTGEGGSYRSSPAPNARREDQKQKPEASKAS